MEYDVYVTMIDLKYHGRGKVMGSNKSVDEVIDRGFKE